jgi:hypothetical protein
VDAYGIAVDDRDAEAYAALFVPDGSLTVYAFGSATPTAEYRGDGLVELIAFVERYPLTLHVVGNHVCRIDGDAATGQTYCVAHHLRADGSPMTLVARYRDRYALTADGWRFASRACRLLWREDGR